MKKTNDEMKDEIIAPKPKRKKMPKPLEVKEEVKHEVESEANTKTLQTPLEIPNLFTYNKPIRRL